MSRAERHLEPGEAGAAVQSRPMSELRTAILGALVVVLGPISLAMYTPAMPALAEAFGTTHPMVKLTLTVFFLGFAFSQLACGPLSDAFGRRPVAIGFLAIYLAGSLVCMLAPTISWLIAGRALQGTGCAMGIAISRAVVRDQFTGQASARIMNLIGTMLAIGPAVSPTLGGLIMTAFNPHAVFVAMALYGVLLVLLFALLVPETNAAPDRALAAPARIVRNYACLLNDRAFMRASLVLGCGLGGLYTLASILPFVLIEKVGLSPTQFGLAMLVQTGSFMVGTLVAGRLLARLDAMRLVPFGIAVMLVAAAGMLVGTRAFALSALSVMAPVGVWSFGMALILPGNTTGALAHFARIAGAASALLGFMQIGGGFLGSAAAALFPDPVSALNTLLPMMALAGLAAHLILRPRAGESPETMPAMDETNLEIAADPLGVVGAAGDEIEAGTYQKKS